MLGLYVLTTCSISDEYMKAIGILINGGIILISRSYRDVYEIDCIVGVSGTGNTNSWRLDTPASRHWFGRYQV